MREFVKKAVRGDADAFGKLYDVHMPAIYRFVFVKVSNKADAEDITHQVFVNAWKGIGSYKIRRGLPFSSWLYRIARNAVIDFYRTSRHHLDIETVPEEAVSKSPGFEVKFDTEVKMDGVREALSKLDDDQESVLLMRFMNDMSYKEIAEAIDKSEGAVRVIQHRALKRLRKIIYESEGDNKSVREA